jgi:hypothetical protein
MAKTITYTDSPSERTVKPTQTKFTNNTDKDITLEFKDGGSQVVGSGKTSDEISKTIASIRYNATFYYSGDPDYTIPGGKTVTLAWQKPNILMNIP